ncbi:MAG: thiol-disulfide oxidoreductase DCC family protein [Bacteriovoracaceae bacterium]
MDNIKTPFLLYDSNCGLCSRFKDALQKLDFQEKIHYYPVGTEEIYGAYPEIDREESAQILHFVDEDKTIHKGGDIAAALAHQFPGINKVAWLLETDAGKKVSDFFYKKVNELRSSSILGGCKNCGGKH